MADKKKCLILDCPEHGDWQSGMCPGCRRYLRRVEALPLSWRLNRQEIVSRWSSRLELAVSHKGTIVHLTSRRRRARHG